MRRFMDEDFLLNSATAIRLYHDYAEKLPIIDYHCHISPKEIYEDKQFDNITEVWLGGDHYKWRLMRANGVQEHYITGNADPKYKFMEWARTLPKAVGNPLYHWSHLELKRYFGYEGILNIKSAEEVWELTGRRLREPSLSARNIISSSGVSVICTTDSPTDSLEWHKKIAADKTFQVKVLPTFRPDNALNIEKSDFTDFIDSLSLTNGLPVYSFASLCDALKHRMDYFSDLGCIISDHALPYVMYESAPEVAVEEIYQKRMRGVIPGEKEQLAYRTALMIFLGREYHRRGWVMQLHYGALRDNNTLMYQKLGPNTGYDCISNYSSAMSLSAFLNALERTGQLSKTIVYSLNPVDNAYIDTVIGCFQDSSMPGKLQHGAAWWFNDHKEGMLKHLTSLANNGLLSNFIGMLTDSRSFLSYTRHEYFRRLLCDMLGGMVEAGEYPEDYEALKSIVQDISYHNVARYIKAI